MKVTYPTQKTIKQDVAFFTKDVIWCYDCSGVVDVKTVSSAYGLYE